MSLQFVTGESDSESVSGTPQKRRDPDPRLSAELEWELRRLRQIQEHEANLIGYTFEDDEENQDQMEEEVIAENEEETEEVRVKALLVTLLEPFKYFFLPLFFICLFFFLTWCCQEHVM